jgi:S1-C subfamily serine protease
VDVLPSDRIINAQQTEIHMIKHLKSNLTIILFISLISCLFVTGCSSIPRGAPPGAAILEVENNPEDNHIADISSEHSADLKSPAVKETEAPHTVASQENLGNGISTNMSTTERGEIVIPIKTLKRDQINESLNINDYRKAVVTILTESGHGSGFIITENGYVLTNQHVVGISRFVNAKLVTGREVRGEVIRTDTIGDVALIKLEKGIYPYVLLGNSSLLAIGDEVYAIGAPLEEESSQTVTRGIVSSFRMERGLRYIQSDVTVHEGNSGGPLVSLQYGVVGVYASGHRFSDRNGGTGLNQFIPVEDAITMLNIDNEVIAIQNIE